MLPKHKSKKGNRKPGTTVNLLTQAFGMINYIRNATLFQNNVVILDEAIM
jgi:hypothetical protein